MAWVACDKNGEEFIYQKKPYRWRNYWYLDDDSSVGIPKNTIKKLIGRELSWDDEPVELKEE